ncbi:adenosine kinase-like protein [Leptomonas pyrrhocoris]|uniref:Adenosine kinase n=1 Tax=Leptomonas pyrrhocoris TaxID=157538 RepID=A0A0N0VGI0_LEPPY|nr:adenosine kinase-like protein [Leptomonas pyrrhocoris]XP_015661538.1 adenosine kinase-like protein [Leptomonas pyrrhocoris]KPA83098.1 adenosine kinase-like protein [Leptomonas pyrrhocoris]KPA83099.1 adenosine kinase-like protein [Leptomonas pyrrhocoris]|eukprot:XP_015661537.1 adenosine kinase-like protein [Leptomonas pyrrhocoris]
MSGGDETIPLYVQCNPLLDVIVDVDEDFLKEYELEKDCAYVYTPRYRPLFETILKHSSLHACPGGSGLHTARVAQWMWQHVLSKTTGHVMYVGCIGKDKYGETIRASAVEDGVTMELEVSNTLPSGLCAVCKVGDARTLIANVSSASALSDDFIASATVEQGQCSASIIYTTAYANVCRVQQTLRLMASARARRLPNGAKQLTAMGLSNRKVLEEFGEDLVDVLEKLDIIIGNEEEMSDLAMMLQWVPTDMTDLELVKKIATEMMYDRHSVRLVVMTRGLKPIVYATGEGLVKEVAVLPKTPTKDKLKTTGAGDAFAGGFLAAFVADPNHLEYCCQMGARAATYVINHNIQQLPTDAEAIKEVRGSV